RSGHGSGRDAGRTGGGRATHRQRHGGGPLQPVPPPPSPAASLPTAFGSPRLGGGGSPLRLHRDEGPPRLRHLSPGEGAVETVRDLGRGCRLAAGDRTGRAGVDFAPLGSVPGGEIDGGTGVGGGKGRLSPPAGDAGARRRRTGDRKSVV